MALKSRHWNAFEKTNLAHYFYLSLLVCMSVRPSARPPARRRPSVRLSEGRRMQSTNMIGDNRTCKNTMAIGLPSTLADPLTRIIWSKLVGDQREEKLLRLRVHLQVHLRARLASGQSRIGSASTRDCLSAAATLAPEERWKCDLWFLDSELADCINTISSSLLSSSTKQTSAG